MVNLPLMLNSWAGLIVQGFWWLWCSQWWSVMCWWCCGGWLWLLGQPNSTYSTLFILASNCWCLDTSVHAFDVWARCLLAWSLMAWDIYPLRAVWWQAWLPWWLSIVATSYFRLPLVLLVLVFLVVFAGIKRRRKGEERKEINLVLETVPFSPFVYFVIFSLFNYFCCNILLFQNIVKTLYHVLMINKA
jgi:hypothetical protein